MILYRFCGSQEQYLLKIKFRKDDLFFECISLTYMILVRNRKINTFVFHFRAIRKHIQLD